MYITSGNALIIPRGDSAEIAVQLIDETTALPYMLSTSEKVQFDLYSVTGVSPIVSRSAGSTAQEADGTVKIMLKPSDTTIMNGTYKYIVRLIDEEAETADTIIGTENDAYCTIK